MTATGSVAARADSHRRPRLMVVEDAATLAGDAPSMGANVGPHNRRRSSGVGGFFDRTGQARAQDVDALAAVASGGRRTPAATASMTALRIRSQSSATSLSANPIAVRCSPPSMRQISARSEESNSSMPASCSMTAGPLSPILPCGVMISRVHSPAAMLVPPNDPTSPATTPITGAIGRRSNTAEQISATALRPRLASCSRTPPVSNNRTAAVDVPARLASAASRSAWLIFAPDTSPVPPPWKPCSMEAIIAGRPSRAPRAITTPSSACGTIPCGSSHGDSRRSNGPHSTRTLSGSSSAVARSRASPSRKLRRARICCQSCVTTPDVIAHPLVHRLRLPRPAGAGA